MYLGMVTEMDKKALEIYNSDGASSAVELVTNWSADIGNNLVKEWFEFFGTLFVRYRDGYKITENKDSDACNCNPGNAPYLQAWYDRIAAENPSHFLDGSSSEVTSSNGKDNKHRAVSKKIILEKY